MIYIKYDYKLYTSEFHGTVVGTGNTQYKTPDRTETQSTGCSVQLQIHDRTISEDDQLGVK